VYPHQQWHPRTVFDDFNGLTDGKSHLGQTFSIFVAMRVMTMTVLTGMIPAWTEVDDLANLPFAKHS